MRAASARRQGSTVREPGAASIRVDRSPDALEGLPRDQSSPQVIAGVLHHRGVQREHLLTPFVRRIRSEPRPVRPQRDRSTPHRSSSPPQMDADGSDEAEERERGVFRGDAECDQEQPARGTRAHGDRGEVVETMRPAPLGIRGIRRVHDQPRGHDAMTSHRLLQMAPPHGSGLAALRAGQAIIRSLFERHAEKDRTSRSAAPALHTEPIRDTTKCPPPDGDGHFRVDRTGLTRRSRASSSRSRCVPPCPRSRR